MNKILCNVLRVPGRVDCTADGLTSKVELVEMYYGELDFEVLNALEEDVLVLVKRSLWGKEHDYAMPYSVYKVGEHSMFGGNFVYTSHSAFPYDRPLHVHDRVERTI